MTKFEELYDKIINESYGNILSKLPFDNHDTYKIVDEIVQSNLLTLVPESLIEVIMNNLIKMIFSSF